MPLRRRGAQARGHPDRRVRHVVGDEAPTAEGPPRRRTARPAPGLFERHVERALDSLPPLAQRLLEDVAIVIEDEPSEEQLQWSGTEHHEALYGLYEGTPATLYAADWVPYPNKISLFRLPLEEDFADPAALEREVRQTVLHELAHHAGIDDDRLHELGLD